jgi:hypothetical protein
VQLNTLHGFISTGSAPKSISGCFTGITKNGNTSDSWVRASLLLASCARANHPGRRPRGFLGRRRGDQHLNGADSSGGGAADGDSRSGVQTRAPGAARGRGSRVAALRWGTEAGSVRGCGGCWPVGLLGGRGVNCKNTWAHQGAGGWFFANEQPPLQSLWIQIRRSRWEFP